VLYLSIDVKIPDIQPHGHPLGIDVGLDSFVATSDGELIDRPKFFIESQHKLKLLNRDVSRKQKGSINQQKARVKVAKLYEKIHNTRKHFQISVAHHLCDTAGMIFAEELNLKALAKGMLGKHCLDAGWGSFLNILGWVAFKRGVYFAKVDSRGTSQLCPVCDTRVSKDLSVRVHECECGYRTNRDVASGQVVLKRGLAAVGQIVKKPVMTGRILTSERQNFKK
jgi:putative transposase